MKIKLEVQGLTYSQTQNNAYALILKESNGSRRLPIIIGGFEAQSIAIQIEKIKYSRPLTHDLFKNFSETFNIQVTEVLIYRLEEGVFYSQLICNNGHMIKEIEARTSDAVSLALRFDCPIYTYEKIMKDASIDESSIFSKDSDQDEPEMTLTDENEFEYYTLEELDKLLDQAVENEDYEQASKIRDEIEKRKIE
ncbi:MAG: bifunctional nuclease family protein [Bacteroidales bacterium]|nr:bifunctional nuclease family protein [Bacteroidales bacterium]MDY0216298.1 bifunctional nuclease family protein [Bacteroidales bacterium]